MVEINNQRRRSSICWRGRADNGRQKTRNHGYDVIVGELLPITRSPSQTCHAKRNSNQQAPDATSLSRWWDAYRKRLGLKGYTRKVKDAVALQQIKERGALPMIDRGDIRQAIDRCSNIWAYCRALVMVSSEHKADNPDYQNSKKRSGTVREIDV